ncbi:hypothetical protein [Kribbella sp. NPDC048915]
MRMSELSRRSRSVLTNSGLTNSGLANSGLANSGWFAREGGRC